MALAEADFDAYWGERQSEFVAGAPYWDHGRGVVEMIMFGGVAGLSGAQHVEQSLVSGYTPEPGDQFGYSLAVADFNGDGFADVAVGVPGETTDTAIRQAGLVHIFYGGSAGAQRAGAQGFDQDSPDVPGTSVRRDFFGQTVAAGDFNDDGFADLVVAAPYKDYSSIGNADVGAAIVFLGTVYGISAIDTQLLQPLASGDPGGLFGYAMSR
jgi:hypothetical protein